MTNKPNKVMLTVRLDPNEATLPAVQRKLKLAKDQIDSDFGVVSIRPQDRLYAILVDVDVANRVSSAEGVQGPYANPTIETLGQPR
jgi:hypothetical protein